MPYFGVYTNYMVFVGHYMVSVYGRAATIASHIMTLYGERLCSRSEQSESYNVPTKTI